MKKIAFLGLVAVVAMAWAGCGSSGSSGGSTSSTSAANSLSDLPSTSTLVTGGGTSASISSKAASGTVPLLKDLSASNVDTYLWNGTLAAIASVEVAGITNDLRNAFWEGEGKCRMAETVGFAFQNILQGGTSMCYMQNAPSAANGVAITSGSATATTLFDQGASNKVVQVQTSNEPAREEGGSTSSSTIYIKVYGTGSSEGSSGYATDLWFCSSSSSTPNGYEQIRVNNTDGTITTTSVHSDFGSFVGTVTAYLTTNSSGQFIFDSTKDRSASVYFSPSSGESFTFLGSVNISGAELLTARDYWTGSFGGQTNTNKHAVFANYSGDTMDALRMLEAAFAVQNVSSENEMSITGGTEYSNTYYANVTSGTLLDSAQSEMFSADIYNGTSSSQYTTALTKLSAVSSFSCSETPNVVVTMDFSQSGPQAVATLCEKPFSNMNFCDSSAIISARNKVFMSQTMQGSCSTSFCPYKIVDSINTGNFACQQWAERNPGNSAGITTLNALCSTAGCCTTQ